MANSIYTLPTSKELKKLLRVMKKAHSKLKGLPKVNDRAKQVEFVRSINKSEWGKLKTRGTSKIGQQEKIIQKLIAIRLLQQEISERIQALRDLVPHPNQLISKTKGWPELETIIIRQAKEIGVNDTDLNSIISFFKGTSLNKVLAPLESRYQYEVFKADSVFINTLSMFCAARMAQLVGEFNEQASKSFRSTTVKPRLSSIETRSKNAIKLLKKTVQAYAGKNTKDTSRYARQLSKAAQQLQIPAAKLAGMIASLRQNTNRANKQLDSYAIRIGNHLRLLIIMEAAGHACEWLASSTTVESALSDKLKPPGTAQNRHKWLQGSGLNMLHVADEPTAGGKIIEGIIKDITITHFAGKPVSTVKVEGKKGAISSAYLSHIKIDSSGIVPGAFVRLRVKSEANIKWLGGKRADIIQRINHEKSATDNWAMSLVSLLIPVFEATPHSLAAEWSWEPQSNGAGNPLKYGVWNHPVNPIHERGVYAKQMRNGVRQLAGSISGS